MKRYGCVGQTSERRDKERNSSSISKYQCEQECTGSVCLDYGRRRVTAPVMVLWVGKRITEVLGIRID